MHTRHQILLRLASALAIGVFVLPGCGNKNIEADTPAQAEAADGQEPLTEAQATVLIASDPEADPDLRRQALITIATSTVADLPVYLDFYRATLADVSIDPTVAAVAAAALGNHGEPADSGRLTPLLTRDEPFLRWQAAVALQRLHNPQAISPLITAATGDDDTDVRIAAATALGQYPGPEAYRGLTLALDDRAYGVSRAAREALKLMTQHDAGDDPRAWRQYALDNADRLFNQPGPFTYTPYPPDRGLLLSILLFWDRPEADPVFPTGYEPPDDNTADVGG
ncbi:MAG: HEAT repeat domain-containing protein [Planctomycetota bacterium]